MNNSYPKTRDENLKWRLEILKKAKKDDSYRAHVKELFHRDILFAYNAFFYTYDVRKKPLHHIPFITWEYQDPVILELEESIKTGKDKVYEKTRDMGVSWMVLLTFLHAWLDPIGGADFLLGSRVEDYVDRRGDMRTLFEKVRYTINHLPSWILPNGYNSSKHDNYMRLLNPESGSVIGGESNNPNFGTGGRYKAILFDEFAKWESTDEAAWTAAGDATPCRVAVSTPFGASGQYYKLVTDGRTSRTRLHWSLHPEKSLGISCVWPPSNEDDKKRMGEDWSPEEKLTSPWYQKECERRDREEILQELDIEYIGTGHPVFDGKAEISLRFYHKLPDEPLAWLKLELEELKFEELSSPPFDSNGILSIYEKLNPKHTYTMGIDVVEGVEDGDFATIVVLDRVTKNVAAFYYSALDEVMLSRAIKIISDYYTPKEDQDRAPWCGVETNGPGLATFDLCVILEVTNLFMAPRYDVVNSKVSFKKGWRTDTHSRNELVAGIRQYLIDRAGKINSQYIVGECLTFVRSRTGKPMAKAGTHDDAVMAFGIALQVDEIAPMEYGDVKLARPPYPKKEDFIVKDREEFRNKDEDTSIEGRCLATTLARKGFQPDWDEPLGDWYA
jgi:hypothetical protein